MMPHKNHGKDMNQYTTLTCGYDVSSSIIVRTLLSSRDSSN